MTKDAKNHWDEYHRAWSRLTPPLRPNGDVIAAVRREIAGIEGRALLLGVTPEYADLRSPLVAIARNIPFIKAVWPGNTDSRWAVAGDWLQPALAERSFSICLGDGSLTTVLFPGEAHHLREEIFRSLRHGGRLVCRVFLAPDTPEPVEQVLEDAYAGTIRNFHTFKLRLAMALTSARPLPNIRLGEFFEILQKVLPDRGELARRTGWPREQIDTIDHYRGSSGVYNFPTRRQIQAAFEPGFSNPRFVQSGMYELAERCPILVIDKI